MQTGTSGYAEAQASGTKRATVVYCVRLPETLTEERISSTAALRQGQQSVSRLSSWSAFSETGEEVIFVTIPYKDTSVVFAVSPEDYEAVLAWFPHIYYWKAFNSVKLRSNGNPSGEPHDSRVSTVVGMRILAETQPGEEFTGCSVEFKNGNRLDCRRSNVVVTGKKTVAASRFNRTDRERYEKSKKVEVGVTAAVAEYATGRKLPGDVRSGSSFVKDGCPFKLKKRLTGARRERTTYALVGRPEALSKVVCGYIKSKTEVKRAVPDIAYVILGKLTAMAAREDLATPSER